MRADLETLIETAPVGVVVLDAETGEPLSFNREARRIVERLSSPGRAVEELLEVITRRLDRGRGGRMGSGAHRREPGRGRRRR